MITRIYHREDDIRYACVLTWDESNRLRSCSQVAVKASPVELDVHQTLPSKAAGAEKVQP
jgi:hypothetical protein